ncbi:hypothetical protein F5B18DRAFT_274202 [Nemania serpens]|nr:hypothetical protein F5B18DRAFT_274202 [Nemania serpens]
MAATRPALSASGCSQCRSLVLKLFTNVAIRPAPIVRPSLSHSRAHIGGASPIRRFSSLPKPTNPGLDAIHDLDVRVLEEKFQGDEDEAAADVPKPTSVPWYLQVETPTHIAPLEPPPLPEIPPDSPPLISSLLNYASEEMGLDALSLLDLRKLEPPPALGPNLFMLFGTARSERHLNVCAGRLVRWLRHKHRVHADADGLLGPNERKTKLRRKAKRAKLRGTVGTDDADDGIRTGWICVNLGAVGRGGTESAITAEDGRVSGFGVAQVGSTVVFQIMTEGRRAEMGLETLWTNALNRFLSPPPTLGRNDGDNNSQMKSASSLHPVEEAMLGKLHRPSGSSPDRKGDNNSQVESTSSLHPVEAAMLAKLHRPSDSSSGRKGDNNSQVESTSGLHPVEAAMLAKLHRPSDSSSGRKGRYSGVSPRDQARFYSTRTTAGPSTAEINPLSTSSSPEELAHALTYDAHQKQRVLQLLRTRLDEMDAQAVSVTLGESSDGAKLTPFMELMERAMETLPPTQTWEYRLAVQYKASISRLVRAVQSLDDVRLLVEELRIYGIQATRHQYLQLLSCIFYAREPQVMAVLSLALDVINTMEQRGESIMASDLIVTLVEGAAKGNDRGRWTTELIERLEQLLVLPNTPAMDDLLLMRLMTAHAHRAKWDGVWNAWGVPARHLRPRSAAMYIHIFKLAAASRSPKLCIAVLRRCLPESIAEDPPVITDPAVRRAALQCIRWADPQALEYAATVPPDSRGELRRIAQREFVKLARLLMSNIT